MEAQNSIIRFYEEATIDYALWSSSFNMHFGYLKQWKDFFSLEKMLNQLSDCVFNKLQISEESQSSVFDLGCGVGAVSRYLAAKYKNVTFKGFTITPWQIAFSEEKDNPENVDLTVGDFTNLPVEANVADGVLNIESACYASGKDKSDLVNEVYRILKPGSKWVVADGFLKTNKKMPFWLNWFYKKNMEGWALDEMAQIKDFLKALEKAGFTNVEAEDVSWRVAPSFLHIPKTVLKFFWKRLTGTDKSPLNRSRILNAIVPLYGMAMGLSRSYFSYYIVTAQKPNK